jgi:hypothetical protein
MLYNAQTKPIRHFTMNCANVIRKVVLPFCLHAPTSNVLSDFLAACDADSLNANDGERYGLIKNSLGGDLISTWETFASKHSKC